MKIIIFGHTGSGKTTQAKYIARLLKLKHIEAGAILRKIAKKNKFIRKIINQGKLVPDNITIKIMEKELKNRKNFILDGYPRTLKQARALKFKPDLVIYLKTSKNNIVKRLFLRKRSDDTKKSIEKRYDLYLKRTLPVINYYKKMKNFKEINGNPSIKKVSESIKKVLDI
ncbi:MAG: nucleoside monophosphate kinase [Nanoarchaeota archaeon]